MNLEPMDESLDPLIKVEYIDVGELCEQQTENEVDPTDTSSGNDNSGLMLDFPGPCDFSLFFGNELSLPIVNSWLYSATLNQVFLRMGNVMHVPFHVDESKAPSTELSIRATPVYASADHIHLPVNRCTLHSLEDDPLVESHKNGNCRCSSYKLSGHVVRSTSNNAVYCYDQTTERHSVLVPIKHGLHDLLFSFACKSSCSRGMERRPIRVVFSLEDSTGLILGRCSLNVKICSCPKRDKMRSEREFHATDGGRTSRKRPRQDDVKEGLSKQLTDHQMVDSLTKNSKVNGKSNNQLVKLKMDLSLARSHITKLNNLCSSIEKALDALDSDI